MTRRDPLLQPFELKHIELPNRICSTAHEPNYSENGLPGERYIRYHEEKAKGGIGLTMIGGSAVVDYDSPPAFGNLCLWDDAIVHRFQDLAGRIHAHGTKIMCQVTHLGRRTANMTGHWLPVVSPSHVREPAHRAFPKVIEDFDVERIVTAYGAAARRCRDGGLDGIEVEAYGHLLDAFWSPMTNDRTDEYGGSLDNRMRFGNAVLAEIRRQVGPDFIVGIRMVIDEDVDGGLSLSEGKDILRRLDQNGLIDFVNIIKGHIDTDEGLSRVIPGMGTPTAPHLGAAAEARTVTDLPIMHAARIPDVATARHALAEGAVDVVGMTRAHMADPHIVAKIRRGEEDRIRPCVGVGYCIDRIYQGEDALCLHNPATGREQSLAHTVAATPGHSRRVVVVVGAGPAGLEAARVSAERGHEVVVFEATDRPGGQVNLATALQRRRDLQGIVDWRVQELERHGVSIRTNVFASDRDVLDAAPDVVIIATGGIPNTDFLQAGEDLVNTTWDVLSGQARLSGRVLVFDDNGGHSAVSAAELLARSGANVEYVTPERALAPDIGGTNYPAYFQAFSDQEVRVTLNLWLRRVTRDGNTIRATFWDHYAKTETTATYDHAVVDNGTIPMDQLYFDLKEGATNRGEVDYTALVAGRLHMPERNPDGRYQMIRIGDAVTCRNIHAAMYDALRVAQHL